MLKIIDGNKKKNTNKTSIGDELESRVQQLDQDLVNTRTQINYFSVANYNNTLPASAYNKVDELGFLLILPELQTELEKHYLSDSDTYEEEEFFPVNQAITYFVNSLVTKEKLYEENPQVLNNIEVGLRELYDNPNLFVKDYNLFRAMQLDGNTTSTAGFWIASIANYGNIYSFKKKIEETIELRNLCIEEKDVSMLLELDNEIRSELYDK